MIRNRFQTFVRIYRHNFKYHRLQSTSSATSDYCLESVKKHDYENYLCTLLLNDTATRSAAIIIRSFNIEVARVVEQVSQPSIGLMRLKFWEEAITKCDSKDITQVPKHPVAMKLHQLMNSTKLTKRYLQNLVASRAASIAQTGFPNMDAMEKYAEQSVSNVYYLLLEGCNVRNVHADHAASHLGKAQGIVQQLRGIPVAKNIRFVAIPMDILAKHNLRQEDILRQRRSEALNECTFEVASKAHIHLVKARSLMENVPKEGRQILLPAMLVENYLQRLQRVHHDVFHRSLERRGWAFIPKLYYNSIKNIY